MQDIASAAELTKGGLYFHFDSKAAILDTPVREFTDIGRFTLDAPELLQLAPKAPRWW
ncbi:MAG: TetR/AcrR family transcriptional regulator [Salinisphaera sp.]|nr:TetR/AcrR family transcriptional regulator [Nevskiaceae bacterium]MDN5939376.1 TetR/AcrR family transcriptional regulator [Salinisphaera sp.]